MMKTCRPFVLLLLISVWILVGCGQQTVVLPTLAPTAQPGSLATLTSEPTEAPTEAPILRATFPPTWTPTPGITEEALPATPTSESAIVQPSVKPTLEVCGAFRDDPARYSAEYTLGSDVKVAWVPVESATKYVVRLLDENGTEVTSAQTTETTYTFSGDLFELGKGYGWSVYPLDALGQQMCFDTGGQLIPH